MKRNDVSGIVLVALGVFLAVGVERLFPACAAMDGMEKSCGRAMHAVCVVGVVLAVTAAVSLKKARAELSFAVAALAVFAACIPGGVVRLCAMPGMRCRTVMRPAVILICVLIAAVAVARGAWSLGRKQS